MKLFLSVPQMWKRPECREMGLTAKDAGIDYVELVYEPQCAAAYYTHKMKDQPLRSQHQIGDVLLVADIGGGTGDFVSYVFRSDLANGAEVALEMIGAADGKLHTNKSCGT